MTLQAEAAREGELARGDAAGGKNHNMTHSTREARRKKRARSNTEQQQAPDARAEEATPEPVQQSADEAGAGETLSPPGGTEKVDPAGTVPRSASSLAPNSAPSVASSVPPSIEPPRSWTKEDKELFRSLPRDTQARLAQRERSRDADFSRRQQEATERSKALEAKLRQVEQARAQYESALPILLQNLQAAFAGEFADIRTRDDIQRLAVSDETRYARWDAQQKRIAATHQEIVAAAERQMAEQSQRLHGLSTREAVLFATKIPEISDPTQRDNIMSAAIGVLRDLGFQDEELGAFYRCESDISLHDHRLQLLVQEGARYRQALAAANALQRHDTLVPPAHLPRAQWPSAAPQKGAAPEQHLKELETQIDNAKGMTALHAASRLLASTLVPAKLVAERRHAGG